MMRLWILRPVEGLPEDKDWLSKNRLNPWDPWYDKCFGFVVRAETESDARAVAAEHSGEEGGNAWLDPEFSACFPLLAEGEPGEIISDYRMA